MDPDLRQRFNAAWSDELHRTVRADLERRLGQSIPFPVAETPVFLTEDLRDRFARASNEIMDLLSDPQFISAHTDAIPAEYRTPGRGHLPQLATIDFAVTRAEDGTLVPVTASVFRSLRAPGGARSHFDAPPDSGIAYRGPSAMRSP